MYYKYRTSDYLDIAKCFEALQKIWYAFREQLESTKSISCNIVSRMSSMTNDHLGSLSIWDVKMASKDLEMHMEN